MRARVAPHRGRSPLRAAAPSAAEGSAQSTRNLLTLAAEPRVASLGWRGLPHHCVAVPSPLRTLVRKRAAGALSRHAHPHRRNNTM
jgi:hypothetical protein